MTDFEVVKNDKCSRIFLIEMMSAGYVYLIECHFQCFHIMF